MITTTPKSGGNPGNVGRFGLTEATLFFLWKAALKDDRKLIDQIIEKIYDDMISFDRQRAETVMALAVRRHRDAKASLQALLNDMEKTNDCYAHNALHVLV
jgi:hypothetical protein